MGEKGSRDKAGKEERKKPKLNPKEKKKLKREKKQHPAGTAIPK
jgi:ribosomal protein S30